MTTPVTQLPPQSTRPIRGATATARPDDTIEYKILTLDVAVETNVDDTIMLRLPNGKIHLTTLTASATRTITILNPPSTDPTNAPCHIYAADETPTKTKIIGISPAHAERVNLQAIDEVPAYYAAAKPLANAQAAPPSQTKPIQTPQEIASLQTALLG